MKTMWTLGGVLVGTVMAALFHQTSGALSVPERAAPSVTVPVSLDGLVLTDESDARTALGRLEGAAVQACLGGYGLRRSDRSTRVCRDLAVAEAVASIGSPRLAAVHRQEIRAAR